MEAERASARERLVASAVHAYTATGSVLALLMVHYSYQGDVETVLWLFLAAMVVDGTDGMLARRFHVKRVLPGFDGALLDNIVDYMTYTLAPMVLLWSNGYLPDGVAGGRAGLHPAAGVVLPVLPQRREDRRPLLPGVPELLEHPGVLRHRHRPRHHHHGDHHAGLRGARVRADQVRLPLAHRADVAAHLRAHRPLVRGVRRHRRRAPGPQRAGRDRLGPLPRLLHGAEPLADLAVPAPGRARRGRGRTSEPSTPAGVQAA